MTDDEERITIDCSQGESQREPSILSTLIGHANGYRIALFQRDALLRVLKDVIAGGPDAIECAKAAVNAIEGRSIDDPANS